MLRPQLRMFLPSLQDLPPMALPTGYACRHFREGDEGDWEHILCESFGREPPAFGFDRMMRSSEHFRPERVLFVVFRGTPVATASAWRVPEVMPDTGNIHWVGVHPRHRGNRLGYWVSLAALHHMVAEDLDRATLTTDDFRLPAIHLYLSLGFEPLLVHDNQRARWRNVFNELKDANLSAQYAQMLEGPVVTPAELCR